MLHDFPTVLYMGKINRNSMSRNGLITVETI